MTHARHNSSSFSFVVIPLAVLLLMFGIFSIVWLRSEVRTVEYGIAQLEEQKMRALKERKMLMAEKASLSSIQNVKNGSDGRVGLVFPDRVKVIYVKKGGVAPFRVSLERRNQTEP